MSRRFTVALSFPGQHRRFVRTVALALAEDLGREKVFFDDWHSAELKGADADLKLKRIYREHSDLIVPFFSEHYETTWCQLEWHAIRVVLFERHKADAVVPVHLDGTRIDGWESVDLGIRRKRSTARQVAQQILEMVRQRARTAEPDPAVDDILVKHVQTPEDGDFDRAMKLYQQRIQNGIPQGDIARWVRDDPVGNVLLAAKVGRKVAGFILFHPLGEAALPSVFLAYLVVRRGSPPEVSNKLLDESVRRVDGDASVKNCQILFEVDRPIRTRKADPERKVLSLKPISRIAVFDQLAERRRLILRAFDIDYVQPSLVCDPKDEQPMLLMSLRRGPHTTGDVPASKVRDILEFIYTELYPSGYSNDEKEQEQFEAYCQRLFRRKSRALERPVPLLTFKQIRRLAAPLGESPSRRSRGQLRQDADET